MNSTSKVTLIVAGQKNSFFFLCCLVSNKTRHVFNFSSLSLSRSVSCAFIRVRYYSLEKDNAREVNIGRDRGVFECNQVELRVSAAISDQLSKIYICIHFYLPPRYCSRYFILFILIRWEHEI